MTDQDFIYHNHDAMSSATTIWNMALAMIPPVMRETIEKTSHKYEMPGLDWASMGDSNFPPIVSLKFNGQGHELTGLKLSPPCGFNAMLYSQ